MSSFLIAPSMLSSDFSIIRQELEALKKAGADWIHWDVMDGHFVPNLTFGAPIIKKARTASDQFFDVHLMIETPEKYIDDFLEAGADSLTLHVESSEVLGECFAKIKKAGKGCGLSLRPGTPLSAIEPYLKDLDVVLVMTVEPGFGGQSFMEDQVAKVECLFELREQNGYSYKIEVDGGVSEKTASKLQAADVLVAGSFIFKNENYEQAIGALKNAK